MQAKKIKTLLIDGSPESMVVLEFLVLEASQDIDIIGKTSSSDKAIELILILNPDLVLLDIEMSAKDGFEVLKAFENPLFKVIIISRNDQDALKAIKFAALDYIFKPIVLEDLKNALNKFAITIITKNNLLYRPNSIMPIYKKAIDKIIVSTTKGFYTIYFDKIISIEAQSGNYCLFKLIDTSFELVTKPLNYFEKLIPTTYFFRIHRSFIINLNSVESFDSKKGVVRLENGSVFEVAVRRRGAFNRNMKRLLVKKMFYGAS